MKFHISILIVALTIPAFAADAAAPVVKKVFLPPRLHMGDTGINPRATDRRGRVDLASRLREPGEGGACRNLFSQLERAGAAALPQDLCGDRRAAANPRQRATSVSSCSSTGDGSPAGRTAPMSSTGPMQPMRSNSHRAGTASRPWPGASDPTRRSRRFPGAAVSCSRPRVPTTSSSPPARRLGKSPGSRASNSRRASSSSARN